MVRSAVLIGLFAASLAAAASAVVDLIPDNFDKIVTNSKTPVLVEYFAPWCGHCKTLAPIYEELAQAFEHDQDKVVIAKLDADAHKSLARKHGIQGFPTLKFYNSVQAKSDAGPIDFNEARDLETLTKFVTKHSAAQPKKSGQSGQPVSHVAILDSETLPKEIGKDKAVLVAFTAPWCGHCKTLAPAWETLAKAFAREAGVTIAKVDAEAPESKDVVETYGIRSYPTIKYFPRGSTEPVPYSSGRTEAALIEYVNKQAGTHRRPDGGLDGTAGVIATAWDVLLDAGDKLQSVLDTAKSSGSALDTVAADYYTRVAKKVTADSGYPERELVRLEKIISRGGIASEKEDEFVVRTNVLRQFLDAARAVGKVGKGIVDAADEVLNVARDEL